jgi:hypothetical protein
MSWEERNHRHLSFYHFDGAQFVLVQGQLRCEPFPGPGRELEGFQQETGCSADARLAT